MCGISALFGIAPDPGSALSALVRMHEALRHRGPDGEGCLLIGAARTPRLFPVVPTPAEAAAVEPTAALAFRWLRIQDPAPTAAQPMASADRRLWLLFNGEVYNYRELREELRGAGHFFFTESDSEVILSAYCQWSTGCFARFNGMWAMVIVDLDRGVAVVSRDRIGVKPLFYALEDDRLVLASESAAVVSGLRDRRPDGPRLHEFLRGFPPQTSDRTFFGGVRPVPAGTWFEVQLAGPCASPSFRPYWSMEEFYSDPAADRTASQVQEEFEHLLSDAVRLQVRAQVRVGCLLSGGLDSSTITALAARELASAGQPPPQAFSVVFSDPAMSEWPYIQLVLAAQGLKGHPVVLTPKLCRSTSDLAIAALGRPLLGYDAIAQFLAYQAAREHGFTVALDGQGADELLGGLPTYEAQIFPELFLRGHWLRLLRELRLRCLRYRNGLVANLKTYLLAPVFGSALTRKRSYDWLLPSPANSAPMSESHDADRLNRYLYRQVRHANLPTVLEQQDHNSMAHSVESRVPCLDHRLVEFCFRLPARMKIVAGERKKPLLDTARKHLPAAVTARTDKRMFISSHRWLDLRTVFRDELRALTTPAMLPAAAPWAPDRVAAFVRAYLNGHHQDDRAVWRILTACRWLEEFGMR